jgi:hypothetical protein
LKQLSSLAGRLTKLCTPALRREQIKYQVALITPLIHVKGHAAPETQAAEERARLLIEQAEALGEPPEDPLLLFSVLFGIWVANYGAFDGEAIRELSAQFLALAEKQRATAPLAVGHRVMGVSLLWTGDIAEGRTHLDRAIAFYDPARIVCWRRDLGKTSGCPSCSIGRGHSGCSATPLPQWQMWTKPLVRPARSVRLPP